MDTAKYAGIEYVDNHMEGGGLLLTEKEEEQKAKRLQKKAKASAKKNVKSVPQEPETTTMIEEVASQRRRKSPRAEKRVQHSEDFLWNKPSPGAVTRDTIGTISQSVAEGRQEKPERSPPNLWARDGDRGEGGSR